MIAFVSLDVVAGPARPIALILAGIFVMGLLLETAVLGLFGQRPLSKAFTNTFFAFIASLSTGFVFWIVTESLKLENVVSIFGIFIGMVLVQGVVLSRSASNLGKARIWWATIAMKVCSTLFILAIMKLAAI